MVAAAAWVLGWRRALVLAVLTAAGVGSGWAASRRAAATSAAEIPEGHAVVVGRASTDPVSDRDGVRFGLEPSHLLGSDGWVRWRGPRLVVVAGADPTVAAGDRVRVTGTMRAGPTRVRGDPAAGRIRARLVEVVAPPSDPLFVAGNWVRSRIASGLERFGSDPPAALLAGFLIGDVRAMQPDDLAALRASGLSHYVAVSGSNVALFLAGWWLVAGPLGWGPRRRAVVGLVGLALFLVVTRWEPSVVRAAAMAAVMLTGRLVGVPVGGWAALGTAVTGLLLVSGDLAADIGFQLSAAATAGVMAGARLFEGRRPRWVWTALGATLAAQGAVAPLLLLHVGTLPAAAPAANVVAAPLVAFATAAGGVGVMTGVAPITAAGLAASGGVLAVARRASELPQVGVTGAAAVAAALALACNRRLRPLVALTGAAALVWAVIPPGGAPDTPEVVFLDVGQGDATLLWGPRGEVILVDGGPDPVVLRGALRARGITRVDLVVVSHRHADHTAGLAGIVGRVTVGRVWHAGGLEGNLAEIVSDLAGAGASAEEAAPGWRAVIGDFEVEVIGPVRHYASANDGSLVVRAAAAGRTVLLPGDIEAIAQADLGPLPADVMKVPHQGAATSDPDWLRASAPAVAVISVGRNDFGHPSPDVIEVLEEAGATVWRTDRDGDVTVRLDRLG